MYIGYVLHLGMPVFEQLHPDWYQVVILTARLFMYILVTIALLQVSLPCIRAYRQGVRDALEGRN